MVKARQLTRNEVANKYHNVLQLMTGLGILMRSGRSTMLGVRSSPYRTDPLLAGRSPFPPSPRRS